MPGPARPGAREPLSGGAEGGLGSQDCSCGRLAGRLACRASVPEAGGAACQDWLCGPVFGRLEGCEPPSGGVGVDRQDWSSRPVPECLGGPERVSGGAACLDWSAGGGAVGADGHGLLPGVPPGGCRG